MDWDERNTANAPDENDQLYDAGDDDRTLLEFPVRVESLLRRSEPGCCSSTMVTDAGASQSDRCAKAVTDCCEYVLQAGQAGETTDRSEIALRFTELAK